MYYASPATLPEQARSVEFTPERCQQRCQGRAARAYAIPKVILNAHYINLSLNQCYTQANKLTS